MRLKQIKLAGFKSFVDITTVPFPQDMTAIVGPNGCGKSNIIDAVRWVLGESSAKNLRGDSMTDVIFNGSTDRKPVGQASVELIFDNSDSRIQGSMADRTEIAIRRLVTRDAQNTYFLNGSKCRRKDITDIFLGTGLGPRSYAIIEQGMISKLIESKPQELRVFIEEAAGVSKYKERRRETETRIKHTRENLLRLADIRQELAIQIEKLHGQSLAANRFRELKSKERRFKAEVVVLKWQQHQQKLKKIATKTSAIELNVEKLVAEQRANELKHVNAQQHLQQANVDLAKYQQHKMTVNTDITRLEQNVKHAKQQKLTLNVELNRIEEQLKSVNEHIHAQQKSKLHAQQQIDQQRPEFDALSVKSASLAEQYHQQVADQSKWQHQWDAHQKAHADFQQQTNVNATQVKSINDLMEKSKQRIEEINTRLTDIQLDTLVEEKLVIEEKIEEQQYQLDMWQDKQQQHMVFVQKNSALLTALAKQKNDFNNAFLELSSKHSAFSETLTQQQDWQVKQKELLSAKGITIHNELIKQIQVTPGWEFAVEVVLGQWLHAHLVDSFNETDSLEVALLISANQQKDVLVGTLSEHVKSAHPFVQQLNCIFLAENPEQAHKFCLDNHEKIANGGSVICPQGHWYGDGWMKKGSLDVQSGQIKRIKHVKHLAQDMLELELKLTTVEQQHEKQLIETDSAKKRLNENDDLITLQTQQVQQSKQALSLHNQELSLKQQHQQQLQQELSEKTNLLTSEQQRLTTLNDDAKVLDDSKSSFTDLNTQLKEQRQQLDNAISAINTERTSCTTQLHQLNLQIEKAKSSMASIEQNVQRENLQLETLLEREKELKFNQEDVLLPIFEQEEQLQSLLNDSLGIEAQLNIINKQLSAENEKMSSISALQKRILNDIVEQTELLSQNKVESETYHVRVNTCLEQLEEMQQSLTEILEQLPAHAKESQWQIELVKIHKEVSSLGAINLAAIEEYETQFQRKDYLDQQNADLESALSTLENAIHKIDNESRLKFKNTFEQVNSDLKELFPKVFGGGSAYLDLTSDDLLESGVTIMARPPGKKNSTIHLLSGGEKALTALSLVFAIFRLNPAPFCMLDEVDAPLDDANVGRFCNLVKEMSQTVQFIYISHNKIAMEMASHLTGVTMFEPGVSRMVAVDIEEAIAMAEVS